MVAFVGGSAFKSLVDYLIERSRQKKVFEVLFNSIHEVYIHLTDLKNHTSAKRVIIVKNEDSGEPPDISSMLVSTALYEVVDNPLKSLKKDWMKQRADRYYSEMLGDVYKNDRTLIEVKEMKDSWFKDMLKSEEIVYIENISLYKSDRSFMYVSLHFDEEPQIDAIHRNSSRIAVRRLLDVFKNKTLKG